MASQTGPPAKLYLRPRQIKERYGISIPTIHRWLSEGKIEGISNGHITLIDVESLEKFLSTWRKRGKRRTT